MRILYWLFDGCLHTWDEMESWRIFGNDDKLALGKSYFCKCTKCGTVKRFDLY
jgi:hypothetical protein